MHKRGVGSINPTAENTNSYFNNVARNAINIISRDDYEVLLKLDTQRKNFLGNFNEAKISSSKLETLDTEDQEMLAFLTELISKRKELKETHLKNRIRKIEASKTPQP